MEIGHKTVRVMLMFYMLYNWVDCVLYIDIVKFHRLVAHALLRNITLHSSIVR